MINRFDFNMILEANIEKSLADLFENMVFTEQPKGLYDPLRYMIDLGGKRVRPRLCLTVYALYKDAYDEGVLSAAAALEIFHSFTLIHDDMMDKAEIRRGKPTVYKKWDENTAILSGDVMSIDSYQRLSKTPAAILPQVLSLFSTTAAQVCEGQQHDMEFESVPQVSMEDYIKMIGLKTAVLIACSAKMGALHAGVPSEQADVYYQFAYDLGLAFQIADDWLDTYGDTQTFGKKVGGDILNDKKTWLLTYALQQADEKQKQALQAAMALPINGDEQKAEKIAAVRAIYDELKVGQEALREIERYHKQAIARLDALSLNALQKEMLVRYASRLIGRNK